MTGDPAWRAFLETEARAHFVEIGEHRLQVVELGAGEPLLLIYGNADTIYTWHHNFRPLAEAGFRVVAYDYPGCGESALPDGFRFGVDDLAALTLALLDTLGIDCAHLIGHSMGGGVGLQLAAHHADRLRRVVLVAPVCYHALYRPFIYLFRWPLFCTLARYVAGPWMVGQTLVREYVDTTLLTHQVQEQYRLACRRPEFIEATIAQLRDFWSDAFAGTARCYGEIAVPLHLIWGERDITVGRRFGRRLVADTGAGLTVIPGAGHLVHQARPEAFNEVAIQFLRGECVI
jgi:pyruvate dehydrogenase E2 component (dihydrolipoamide acetyltransferase)